MVDKIKNAHRLVHLDLKGSPMKVSYLEKLFPILVNNGATGLLIEWEDTFPYSGNLTDIGSVNTPSKAYSADEIRFILHLAQSLNLVVIPLIQTIGHLEFVLKHEKWKHLREVARFPSCLCPSNVPDAVNLVTCMLDQIIKMHPQISTVHIGADEVWSMGVCDQCKNQDKHHLFLNHVNSVVNHLRSKHPSVTSIIMWDDMLRSIKLELLKEYDFWDFVEPMVWHYQSAEFFQLDIELWKKYSFVFTRVWFASAFKGASGSCQILPVISQHISNHEKWSSIVSDPSFSLQFQGIALTGWSRFDHYAILCELMPVAIPSLVLCLKTWIESGFSSQIHSEISTALGYLSEPIPLNPYPRPQPVPEGLNFPNWQVLTGVGWFANFRTKYQNTINSDHFSSWLNPWQRKKNFLNLMQSECLIKTLFGLRDEIDLIIKYLRPNLLQVYYESVVDEWFGSVVNPILDNLVNVLESLPPDCVK